MGGITFRRLEVEVAAEAIREMIFTEAILCGWCRRRTQGGEVNSLELRFRAAPPPRISAQGDQPSSHQGERRWLRHARHGPRPGVATVDAQNRALVEPKGARESRSVDAVVRGVGPQASRCPRECNIPRRERDALKRDI